MADITRTTAETAEVLAAQLTIVNADKKALFRRVQQLEADVADLRTALTYHQTKETAGPEETPDGIELVPEDYLDEEDTPWIEHTGFDAHGPTGDNHPVL